MDDTDLTDETAIGFPVSSSVEKLHAALAELGNIDAASSSDAAMLSLLAATAPMLLSFLPSDPAELDDLLLKGSRWMLGMRSDDAWQPEDLDELFLGDGESS